MRSFNLMTFTMVLLHGCANAPTSPAEDSYLVFGHFYGECIGEVCVEIFKIENNTLYEDTLDNYPTYNKLPHNTSYMQLPNDKYEKVEHLLTSIPRKLFSENALVIGQPDAGDWGGLYLETNLAGKDDY